MIMNINITFAQRDNLSPLDDKLISDETTKVVLSVLMYGVKPSIACVGIVCNILSIVVISKQGLHKCSNILLVSLAIMDSSFLIGFNNVSKYIYEANGNVFPYTQSLSHFLYVLFFVFQMMDYGIGLSALTLPMLITLERIVAVFMPLKFHLIITPVRTWIAVAAISSYWIAYVIYTCFWFQFSFAYDSTRNESVGLMERSDLFFADLPNMKILEEVYFSLKLPPLFTFIGCVAIIIKVKMASLKRKTMTSKSKSTSKTTKTLLAICTAYLFTCACVALPAYFPKEWMSYSMTSDEISNLAKIMHQCINVVGCVNSSWNFLAYFAFNPNFRQTFNDFVLKRKSTGGNVATTTGSGKREMQNTS